MHDLLQESIRQLMSGFVNHPAASAFGLFGLLCLTIWPLFHRREVILELQFGIGAGYFLHYALLGAWTGAGITALGMSQTLVSFFLAGHPRVRLAAYGFLPLAGVITAFTWEGMHSLLGGIALTLIMIGRMQLDEIRMRAFLLAAAPFGMGYDLTVGSLPALLGGLTAAAIGAFMLVREIRERAQLHRRHRHAEAAPHARHRHALARRGTVSA